MSTSAAETITSYRALARLLGRAHTTVMGWTAREDWPFAPDPPWPVSQAAEMEEWADDNLQEDRNHEQRERAAQELVTAPGRRVTWQDVAHEDGPFNCRRCLGSALFGACTVADFESLASHLTFALFEMQLSVAKAEGADGVLAEATPAYYTRLLSKADPDEFLRCLNHYTTGWILRRFAFERPGFWRELAEPWDEAPTAAELKCVEPLAHRKSNRRAKRGTAWTAKRGRSEHRGRARGAKV